jgi:hypothetical protein
MSYSIQNWQPRSAPYQPQLHGDALLRHELGWSDVASGLARILYGYFLLFVIVAIWVFMTVALAYTVANTATTPRPRANAGPPIQVWWILGLGGGIIFLMSIYAYIQLFVGKVRCAIHAPERCGARWFIFACLLTIIVGPAMSMIDWVNAQVNPPSVQKQREQLRELERIDGQNNPDALLDFLRRNITVTQIAGMLISMATTVFFVLFLRSIGTCFEESRLTVMADLYLMFSALLYGFTIFLVFFAGFNQSTLLILGGLAIGALASIAWYIGLVVYTRILILNRITKLRSPLEEQT